MKGESMMEEIFPIIFRTLFLYVLILIIFRVMGKREIGELSIIDLVVYLMIAEIMAIGIDKVDTPIIHTVLPIALLVGVQIISAFISLKSRKFRNLVEGEPVVIINQGKIDEHVMRKQRYNFDDLLLQLREKNVRDISDVEFAILETNGKLTVIEKEKNKKGITIPLILDGEILEKNLKRIEKDVSWLKQELHKREIFNFENISFCSYQNGKFFIDFYNEPDNKKS